MNALQLSDGQPVKMTSLEIVNFINAQRKEEARAAGAAFPSPGYAKLEHSDFMKKVPEVIGSDAGNFSGIYRDSRNREQDCYDFPKREASLMAMSYSYKIQAAVWDHMTAMEEKLLAKQAAAQRVSQAASQSGLPEFRRARALDLATKTAERLAAQFPSLSEDSRRTLFAKVINPVAGTEILVLPRVEQKHYTAGEVGDMLGISANMIGRIANLHGLKTEENGQVRLDKSRHSVKQVESFVYNDSGVAAIRRRIGSEAPGHQPAATIESHGAPS